MSRVVMIVMTDATQMVVADCMQLRIVAVVVDTGNVLRLMMVIRVDAVDTRLVMMFGIVIVDMRWSVMIIFVTGVHIVIVVMR